MDNLINLVKLTDVEVQSISNESLPTYSITVLQRKICHNYNSSKASRALIQYIVRKFNLEGNIMIGTYNVNAHNRYIKAKMNNNCKK